MGVALALLILGADRGLGAPAAAGNAPGGKISKPSTQWLADKNDPQACADNAVVLLTVRGSGARYGDVFEDGRDHTLEWLVAARKQAIARGYRVRHLQWIYHANPLPLHIGVAAGEPVSRYLRDAKTVPPAQIRLLGQASRRCPNRPILIGGFSQGNIQLRAAMPKLGVKVVNAIRSVDLIADPTAARNSDSGLRHPKDLGGRLTARGIIHFRVSAKRVAQSPYRNTGGLRQRIYQYCAAGDRVCDHKNAVQTAWFGAALKAKAHFDYRWAAIGRAAANRLPALGQPTPPPAPDPDLVARVSLAYGSQSVNLAGLQLKGAVEGPPYQAAPLFRARFGPPDSCERFNNPGAGRGTVLTWQRHGIRAKFNDLGQAPICGSDAGWVVEVQLFSPTPSGSSPWIVSTERGDFRVGTAADQLPAPLRQTALQPNFVVDYYSDTYWPEQDPCAARPIFADDPERAFMTVRKMNLAPPGPGSWRVILRFSIPEGLAECDG
ncbi:cutinase family protein [Miltoncostaea oceani]|uniref:cutinase family protein n=1 Tax=Miltoncostaea oceani TaxID=2843216 RepID=UPI001C3CE8EF|nr:cutinase family protein [Miltoncostaea oceani]